MTLNDCEFLKRYIDIKMAKYLTGSRVIPWIHVHKAVITLKYTVYGIRYTLYDLLSATDDNQVM